MKRALDFILSLTGLLVLSPVFAALALLIRREDGGAIFFTQPRVGRGGKLFRCYKFRTMCCDAEQMLHRWRDEEHAMYRTYVDANYKLHDDPRVTRIGRWLRKRSLDELPQLLNVLKGEMSLVGPRPLLPDELSAYGANFSCYKSVRPGLTGLWQVSGRSNTTFSRRIELDVHYIENCGFLYDVEIMWRTVRVLASKTGAY